MNHEELIERIKSASQQEVTVRISAVNLIRLLVWGKARDGRDLDVMAGAVLADRAGDRSNMKEALQGATLQASVVGVSVPEWIKALIKDAGLEVDGKSLADLPDEVLYSVFGAGPIDLSGIDTAMLEALASQNDLDD